MDLAGDNHRRPPLNTWGDDPDPNSNSRGENDVDVLPTSFQDNDPIRRPCVGITVGNALRQGEEVCNRDGTLGLVVPVPASDFIGGIPDPNHAGQNLGQYPANPCNNFLLGTASKVLSCAPRNATVHPGECPNGDLTFGAAHTCEVPVDSGGNASQCQESRNALVGLKQRVTPISADSRVFNLHLRDGKMTDGTIGYVRETIPGTSITLDFAGGYSRAHEVETVPANLGGCLLSGVTSQLGCLVHADRCSIGMADSTAAGADNALIRINHLPR